MNIHTTVLCLPLTEPALLHSLAGWREEEQSPSPVGFRAYFERKGPFEKLSPGGHSIIQTHSCCFLPHWQYCSHLAMYVVWLQVKLDFHCLSHEIWGAEQSRRSPVGSATFSRPIVTGKHTAACCQFFPEGRSRFPHSVNSCPRFLEKCFLESLSEGQLSLSLGY